MKNKYIFGGIIIAVFLVLMGIYSLKAILNMLMILAK